ncbi:hypothetical protein BJX76DRAFT_354283 [Aspergillus varians]
MRIITPYAAQRDFYKRAILELRDRLPQNAAPFVETVDSMQWRETRVVIVGFPVSDADNLAALELLATTTSLASPNLTCSMSFSTPAKQAQRTCHPPEAAAAAPPPAPSFVSLRAPAPTPSDPSMPSPAPRGLLCALPLLRVHGVQRVDTP